MSFEMVSRRRLLQGLAAGALAAHCPMTFGMDAPEKRASHRIMTCNILLDLVEHHGTAQEWEAHRRKLCERVIKSRNPDIICLQEVGRVQNRDFVEMFPGYKSFGYLDPHVDANPPRFQGIKNVIFYSSERYEQTSAGIYWLSETPLIAGSKLPRSDQPRHVTWLRLRQRENGREFRVINTHWELIQAVRMVEAGMIDDEAAQYPDGFPQILAGDFNSDRTSPEHELLLKAGWKETYESVHGVGEPGYTGHGYMGINWNKPTSKGKIDFIFCRGLAIPLNAEIIREHEGEVHPSDHYFVSADVEF